MIITIKTLQQKAFKVEIDESKTVLDLKKKIEEEQGAGFPASALKLIYSGKVLSNDVEISEYKVQENNFMVVMVSKAKPAKTSAGGSSGTQETTAAPSSGQSSTSQTGNLSTGAAQPQAPEASSSTTAPTFTPVTLGSTTTTTPSSGGTVPSVMTVPETTRTTPQTEGQESSDGDDGNQASGRSVMNEASTSLVTGEDYETAVVTLMNLGYERDRVVEALHASFNNPDRAADRLLSGEGIADAREGVPSPQSGPPQVEDPEPVERQAVGQQPQQQQQQQRQQEGDLLQALMDPRARQMLGSLRNNPDALSSILASMQQSNPQLFALIRANPERFIELINSLDPASGGASGQGSGQQPGRAEPPMPGGLEGSHTIRVTQEEKEAIERLKALGFSEAAAVQAYFACDKNEELAANFLFSDDSKD